MSSLFVDLDTDSVSVQAVIPLAPIEEWWEGLVRRNAKSRARDHDTERFLIPDLCPYCKADPLHFTVVDSDGTCRVCRKCNSIIGYLCWVL